MKKIPYALLIVSTTFFAACQLIPVKNLNGNDEPTPNSQLLETESSPVNNTSTPEYSKTTYINNPTEKPSVTPTEYLTPTPTTDPAFTDKVFFFELKMKEGDVVWSVFEVEKIVNSYEDNLDISFSEYISQAQQNIKDVENFERVYSTLEEIRTCGELTDVKLVKILKDNFAELDVVDIPQWPENSVDLLPEEVRERLDTKEFDIFDIGDNLVGQLWDQFTHLVHIGVFRLAPEGSLVFDLRNYYSSTEDDNKVDLLITIGNGIDELGQIRALCVTVDDNGKIKNVNFNGEYTDYYSEGPAWFIISNQDPFGMPTFNN